MNPIPSMRSATSSNPNDAAHPKADARRFAAEPVRLTGFGDLPQAPDWSRVLADIREADADEAAIAQRGSARWLEVLDEERECQRADERYEDRYGSEE